MGGRSAGAVVRQHAQVCRLGPRLEGDLLSLAWQLHALQEEPGKQGPRMWRVVLDRATHATGRLLLASLRVAGAAG